MSDERIRALEEQVAQLTAALQLAQPQRTPAISGTFTPPTDLLPAVMALESGAFEQLKRLTAGRAVTCADLVAAADWYEANRRIAA